MEERPWCAAPSLPTGGVELHSPGNMSLRPSAAAPKRAWDSGESSSLPPARRRSAASHPSPKRENYVDKCLWKFPHNMSVNQFYQRPCRTRKQFLLPPQPQWIYTGAAVRDKRTRFLLFHIRRPAFPAEETPTAPIVAAL